ncbi:tripartite tricarboxylate transporter substrate binding protein [Pelagibius litoralis]|uniref:Tripartite tricarboxylate transporter substrate binding protein n=1 Tax=Pelagibius litoralis TaxID=374515 RepID=A0A967F0M6_9PROT|nr:tripartite tricarboxylate transporter substrate binding protein [Pelagibius litoralis]NIA70825.1 tripartite tricarboxylate transporter substrate binding protein [Pelagibius litoralis]
MKLKRAMGIAAAAVLLGGGAAQAEYPERSIGMMIPFSAGGGTDVPGRFFAAEMEKILGTDIVVSNVTGAGGTIGATQLSQARADGYKLGFMPVGTTTTQPHLRRTSYNGDSWAPICLVAQGPQYVTVLEDSPVKTVDDLIAKAKSGKLVTGGPPPGSLPHIAQAAVANAYGVKFTYIPHEGINEVAKSMLGGRVDMAVWFGDAKARFGLRPLAILDSKRSAEFPDVPTLAELGQPVESFVWFGFFAPKGTPDAVVSTLSDACEKAVNSASFRGNMEKAKRQVRYMPRDEFAAFFARQYEQNGSLLKEAGLVK